MPDQTVFPCIYIVSDGYPTTDTGEAGGYDDSTRLLFPDIDFGAPDHVKRVHWIEVFYQSLKELPITATVWYRKRLGDAGATTDTDSLKTEVAATVEPGVAYNAATPEWSTDPYATMRAFSQRLSLDQVTGKSFDIGLIIDANMMPFKLTKLAIHVTTAKRGAEGTVVLGATL